MAAKFLDAFQFTREVNGLFPVGNGLGGLLADVADAEQLAFGRLKNFGRVAEMFQQLPRPHRPDMLDEVQCDKRFA